LLDLWEQGHSQTPVQRALALLAAADPRTPLEVLERLSIGERDARLLTLREWTFGPRVVSVANCPQCGERLEMAFNLADVRVPARAGAASPGELHGEGQALVLEHSGYRLSFRPPNSHDLASLAASADPQQASRQLVRRCLLEVEHDGQKVERPSAARLPAALIKAVEERIAQADPQADVTLALTCPACSHRWDAIFDVLTFFWTEIQAWAPRILREVHQLASAYGWSEAEILALSPGRRQAYLEMIAG
jgi:hypothetical protein